MAKTRYSGPPEKKKAEAEKKRHMAERPSVTAANKTAHMDRDKKFESTFGVGAKGAGPGGKMTPQQLAAAKVKTEAYKAREGYYPVEDVTRPVTQGGVRVDYQRGNMRNKDIDRLNKIGSKK